MTRRTAGRVLTLASAVIVAMAISGCSPEESRVRGGGPGADVGNRGANLELHPATSQGYYGTPNLNPTIKSK